jgi:hypothetical protein
MILQDLEYNPVTRGLALESMFAGRNDYHAQAAGIWLGQIMGLVKSYMTGGK